MNLFKKKHPLERSREPHKKQEIKNAYEKELHIQKIKQAKKRARVDARKQAKPLIERFGGVIDGFNTGVVNLSRGSDKIAESMFGGNSFEPQRKKAKKRPRKRVTEYY